MVSRRGDQDTSTKPREQTNDATILASFVKIVSSKFRDPESVQRLDSLYNKKEYAAEKARLTTINNNGMGWGIAAGLGTFVFFRRGPRWISTYLMKRGHRVGQGGGGVGPTGGPTAGSGYKFEASTSVSPFQSGKNQGGSAGFQNPRKPSLILRGLKLCLDLFVSTTVALYSSAVFTDKKKLVGDVADLPLVEGRSLLADELCGDFSREYRAIPQEVWAKHRGETPILNAIEEFVINCKRREMFEKQIKAERGIQVGGAGDHVIIPPPGVPRDSVITIEDVLAGDSSEADEEETVAGRKEMPVDFLDDSLEWNGQSENNNGNMAEWTSGDDFEGNGSGENSFGSENKNKRPRWGS